MPTAGTSTCRPRAAQHLLAPTPSHRVVSTSLCMAAGWRPSVAQRPVRTFPTDTCQTRRALPPPPLTAQSPVGSRWLDAFNDTYVRRSGFSSYAEANNLVVLYPQLNYAERAISGAQRANCWDQSGEAGDDCTPPTARSVASACALRFDAQPNWLRTHCAFLRRAQTRTSQAFRSAQCTQWSSGCSLRTCSCTCRQ